MLWRLKDQSLAYNTESFISICGIDRKDQHKLQQLTIYGLYKQVSRVNGFLFQCTPVIIFALQGNSISMTHTLFLIYADIYDLFVMLEEKLTITLHIVQSSLNNIIIQTSIIRTCFPGPVLFFFYTEHSRLEKMRSSFLRVGPKIWNSLPSDMRNLPKSTFRKKTRNKLFEILSKSDDYLEITEIMHQLKFN